MHVAIKQKGKRTESELFVVRNDKINRNLWLIKIKKEKRKEKLKINLYIGGFCLI